MKKITSILLILTFIFVFTACSKSAPVNEEIKAYFDQGYELTMTTLQDDTWAGILQKDNSFIKISSPTSKAQQKAYESISVSDEDYDEQSKALVLSFTNATIEDLSSQIPSQEELDAFVGKTLGEMEEAGFENVGTFSDENSYVVTFDGPVYEISVTVADDVDLSDLNNYSPNQINQFKIASVEFVGFAWGILE